MKNKLKLRKIIVILFCILNLIQTVSADDWVLGAAQFTYAKQTSLTSTQEGLTKVIPSLILEQISVGSKHLPGAEELYYRQNQSLKAKRTSLFLQLSKEIKSRDSLLLTEKNPAKLKKLIKAEDEKIALIQKEIEENLVEEEKLLNERKAEEEAAKNQTDITFNEKKGSLHKIVTSENVVLYKSSYDALLEIDSLSGEVTPSEIEKACKSAKINGLLTGRITSYGDYIMVNVEIRTYPGGSLLGAATDIGTIKNLQTITSNLVQELMPKIANALPVELYFDIFPAEKKSSVILSLDGVIYNPCPKKIIVESGLHSLEFDCPSSNKIAFTYDFSDNPAFYISLPFTEKIDGQLNLYLKNQLEGSFYSNGKNEGNTNENYFTSISINGNPVIGQFISNEKQKVLKEKKVTLEDGSEVTELVEEEGEPYSTFFYIPKSALVEDSNLLVNVKLNDLNEMINKRRIWMYRGYTAFVISVPVMMIANGMAQSTVNAYNSGLEDSSTAIFWNTAKYITIGTTVASAGFFIYELVRYLNAASGVLPVNAYPVSDEKIPHFEKSVPSEEEIETSEETKGSESEGINIENTEITEESNPQ